MTITVLQGDCRDVLRSIPDQHFDVVVTSPPYWGLRDYDVAGQLGLEPTLGEHLDTLVAVFREIRRVLKRHGTLWLNYGDCYATAPNGRAAADVVGDDRAFRDKPFSTVGPILQQGHSVTRGQRGDVFRTRSALPPFGRVVAGGFLKPKDLCMIANRLAIALQDDGWWVRSEIIWHKPNPMPESVYDRPTSAHEKLWLLTKGEDYYYDHEAIREACSPNTHARVSQDVANQIGSLRANGGSRADRPIKAVTRGRSTYGRHTLSPAPYRTPSDVLDAHRRPPAPGERLIKANERFHASTSSVIAETRNARNVWTIAPKAFREAHFATFPPALVERCSPAPRTVCAACGSAESCGGLCGVFGRVPGRVLDPFGGSGTVGVVADALGLDCTLIDLSEDYCAMARRRIFGAEADRVSA